MLAAGEGQAELLGLEEAERLTEFPVDQPERKKIKNKKAMRFNRTREY